MINDTSENQSQTEEQPLQTVKPVKTYVHYRARLMAYTRTSEDMDAVNNYNATAKRGRHDYTPVHAILDSGTSDRADLYVQGDTVLYDDRAQVFANFLRKYDDEAYNLTRLLPDMYIYLSIYKSVNYGSDDIVQTVTYHDGVRYDDIDFRP